MPTIAVTKSGVIDFDLLHMRTHFAWSAKIGERSASKRITVQKK